MKDRKRPNRRKRDNPLGKAPKAAQADKPDRIYFVFGKDQSPQAIADTINKAMGLTD